MITKLKISYFMGDFKIGKNGLFLFIQNLRRIELWKYNAETICENLYNGFESNSIKKRK